MKLCVRYELTLCVMVCALRANIVCVMVYYCVFYRLTMCVMVCLLRYDIVCDSVCVTG